VISQKDRIWLVRRNSYWPELELADLILVVEARNVGRREWSHFKFFKHCKFKNVFITIWRWVVSWLKLKAGRNVEIVVLKGLGHEMDWDLVDMYWRIYVETR
jgi:hypothetical protein